jgi:SSS family solute:Na+ symporter
VAALVIGHTAAAIIFVLALADFVIVQTQALTTIETELVAAGAPVVHFLYVAPIVFAVSAAALIAVSLATPAPDPNRIRELTWSRGMFHDQALHEVPFYKDYRYLSFALLLTTFAFVAAWW